MKYFYGLLLVSSQQFQLGAQIFDNAFKIQSPGSDRGKCILTDNSGNVITAGHYGGSADFDPSAGTASLTPSGGSTDIYIAKYDAAFNYIWAISLGGSQSDYPYALAADASSNIIVGGDFAGTMHLNSSFTPSSTLNSDGSSDRNGFIAKYDLSGNLLWGISLGGTNKDVVYGLETDASKNVYVTGYFGNTVDFDPSASTYTLASNGGRDIFLAKYDSTGRFIWAFHVGGTISTAYEEGGQDLIIKGQNIYLTGNFEGTADFDPAIATNNLISNGSLDIFVAKYDTAGNYIWALGAGSSGKHDYSYGIGIDASENVYITGGFEETVDFDPSPATATLVSASSTAQDIFVAKYTSSGSYAWVFQAGGNSLVDDHGFDIDVSPQGDVYITGEFWGPADFDPSPSFANISTQNDQIFIARYTASGNLVWAFEIGGTSSNGPADNGWGIHLAASGKLLVTGDFSGTADFDPGIAANTLSVNNQGHAFVAAYSPALTTGINSNSSGASSVEVYPNPAQGQVFFRKRDFNGEKWSLHICDISGKILFKAEDLNAPTFSVNSACYAQGVYFCHIRLGDEVLTRKLVIQ